MVFSFSIYLVWNANAKNIHILLWEIYRLLKSLISNIYIQRRKHFTMKCFVLLLRLKIRTFINLTTKTSTRKGGDDRISLLRQPHSNFFHIRSKLKMKKVIETWEHASHFIKFHRKKFCHVIFSCRMCCQSFNNDLDKTPLLE